MQLWVHISGTLLPPIGLACVLQYSGVCGHEDQRCWRNGKRIWKTSCNQALKVCFQQTPSTKVFFIVTCRNTSSTVVEKTNGISHCATERDLQLRVNSHVTALTTVNSTDIKGCHHGWSLHLKLSIVLCWCRDTVFSTSDTQLKGWALKGTKLHKVLVLTVGLCIL